MKLPYVNEDRGAEGRGEAALSTAWRNWTGSLTLAPGEMTLQPDLQLAPGAPVDQAAFLDEHCSVGPVQPIGCHFLSDVTVAGILYPFLGDDLIDDGSHLSMVSADWLSRFPTHRPGAAAIAHSLSEPVLPVAGPGHQTYGHWIIDFLPRVAVARELLGDRFGALKFLVLGDTPTWAFSLMNSFFNIRERDCILLHPGTEEIHCQRLLYPTFAHSYPFRLHSFIRGFYRSFHSFPAGQRRLCVQRRSAQGDTRPFERRAAFEQQAVREGFELVDPQGLPIGEQARLFASASAIIGEYGSALHNSVFSPSGTLFGVLNAPGVEQTRLCAAFGQPIIYMPSTCKTGPWSLTDEQLQSFFAEIRQREGGFRLGDAPDIKSAATAQDAAADAPTIVERRPVLSQASNAEEQLGAMADWHGSFTAATIYGTALAVDIATGELVHAATCGPQRPAAIVYMPVEAEFAFILFDNNQLMAISPRFKKKLGPIVVVRRRLMPGGTFAFSDPHEMAYLLAHNDIAPDGVGMVAFSGQEVGDWQHYRLDKFPERALSKAMSRQIGLIEHVLATPPTQIAEVLRGAAIAERGVIAALLTGTLRANGAELLADYLLSDTKRLAELTALCPDDPWARAGLPDLRLFLQKRRARATLLPSLRALPGSINSPQRNIPRIGVEFDRLATDGDRGAYVSPAHRVAVMARRAVPPVDDVCILTSACNDGLYLIDWIAYHRSIGVSQFFVYTNDNTDGSDQLLRALALAGEIFLVENAVSPGGISPVYKAYGHALSILPEILDFRWCAIIDSDEMIGLDRNQFRSIQDYVSWHESEPVDAIALNWVVFGSSGSLRWENQPLPYRFRHRYAETHIKTIFRPRLFHHAMPHFPYASGDLVIVCRDATGQRHPVASPHSPTARDSPAWIAHYFFRSFEEFIWKFSRGRGDHPRQHNSVEVTVPDEFMDSFVRQHTQLPLIRDDRLLAFADGMGAEVRRLKGLPGVTDALGVIDAHYRQRSIDLKSALLMLRENCTPRQAEFYDLYLE